MFEDLVQFLGETQHEQFLGDMNAATEKVCEQWNHTSVQMLPQWIIASASTALMGEWQRMVTSR
jgi:hypothetical protein